MRLTAHYTRNERHLIVSMIMDYMMTAPVTDQLAIHCQYTHAVAVHARWNRQLVQVQTFSGQLSRLNKLICKK